MRFPVLRLLCFAVLLLVSHLALIAVAAMASPSLKATIAKYSNVPLGLSRDHIALRFDELERISDVDILFVGSSHSLRTFDPRYFERSGIRAFNLGTANQTPMNTYYLLERYLPRLKPRLVVVEAFWETFAISGVEGAIAITVNRGPGWDTVKMALATRHIKALNSQWSSLTEQLFDTRTAIRLQRNEVYTSGGYLERWDSNDGAEGRRTPRDLNIDPSQVRYLDKTLRFIRDHDAKAVLVWAPVTPARRDMTRNLREFRQRMTDLAETHDVPFVKLDDGVPLDDRQDFFDDDHLNQRGVDKVMPVFIQVLRDNRLLDDVAGRLTVHQQ